VKTCVKNTALCTIAFLLFLFGNSVKVIHFCCDVCRVQGTNVFIEENCHEKPGTGVFFSNSNDSNQKIFNGNNCCAEQKNDSPFQLTHEHEVCSLICISIILDEFQKSLKYQLLVQVTHLFSANFLKDLSAKTTSNILVTSYSYAIQLAGRQLLNKICVLRN